jgi:hypothetical protein
MSRGQMTKYLKDGASRAGRSLVSGKKTLKRNYDTKLASVASLRAQEDA